MKNLQGEFKIVRKYQITLFYQKKRESKNRVKNPPRRVNKITLGEKKVRSAAKLPNIYACPK